jgi:hypothetical protein
MGIMVLAACAPATAGTPTEGAVTPQAVVDASLVFDGVTVVDVEQGTLLPAQRVAIASGICTPTRTP